MQSIDVHMPDLQSFRVILPQNRSNGLRNSIFPFYSKIVIQGILSPAIFISIDLKAQ
jgi:hypothetical protein